MIDLGETVLPRWILQRCQALSLSPPADILWVSIPDQRMIHFQDEQPVKLYPVSTSKNPPSCIADSYGTPTGLHFICEKIGAGEPSGTVFKGRKPVGQVASFTEEERQANLITARILRLRGLEPGHNAGSGCDSFERFVYIHGTNHPERIGEPFSGGCVEMLDADILALFEQIEPGTWVAISS